MLVLTDGYNRYNLTEYGIVKYKRLVRSVFGAEPFDIADAWDDAILIQQDLSSIFKKKIQIATNDSAIILNVTIKTLQLPKRLIVHIKVVREACDEEIID